MYHFSIADQLAHIQLWKGNLSRFADYKFFRARNVSLEETYLQDNFHLCPLSTISDIKRDLADFQPLALLENAQYNFYDPDVMRAIKCTLDALFYAAKDPEVHIRMWLRDLVRIGGDSVEGIVLQPTFATGTPFLIKTAKDPNTDIRHELAVGLIVNNLRQFIPNFTYTYTGFRCSAPSFKGSQVTKWCENQGDKVLYIVIENITPSISFRSQLRVEENPIRVLDKIVQLMLALHIAHVNYNFTHFDLHTENILIRQYADLPMFQIPYHVGDQTFFVQTDAIATIIDYGFSTVCPPGTTENIANWGIMRAIDVVPNDAFPLHDIFRLVVNTLPVIYPRVGRLYDYFRPLFSFFNHTDAYEEFSYEASRIDGVANLLNYVVPDNNMSRRVTYLDFFHFLWQIYPEDMPKIVQTNPWSDLIILGCANDTCLQNVSDGLAQFGFATPAHPDPLVDIYHNITNNFNVTSRRAFGNIIAQYPTTEYAQILYETATREYQVFMHRYTQLADLHDTLPMTLDNNALADSAYRRGYQALLEDITSILDHLSYVHYYANIAMKLLPIYRDSSEVVSSTGALQVLQNILCTDKIIRSILHKIQQHYHQILENKDQSMDEWWRVRFPYHMHHLENIYHAFAC